MGTLTVVLVRKVKIFGGDKPIGRLYGRARVKAARVRVCDF